MSAVASLTTARRADRALMRHKVAALAITYGLAAHSHMEEPGTRQTSVDLVGPHGLKVTVKFDGRRNRAEPDSYVLSWYGVEDGTRLNPAAFGNVNPFHGHKATDVTRGFRSLMFMLECRFISIREGSAFVSEVQP